MNVSNSKAEAIPLAIEPRIKSFVNNQRFADVTFLVGEEKEIVHAHKNMIASGSPVFEAMFFAKHNLQMSGSEPIEIPDLTATGFINMLKYIYTNDLKDLDLSELFETFLAGDKYQVYNMNETMLSFIKDNLNTSNCCIIYDQLMKFPSEYVCLPVDQVTKMISWNSLSAFENEHFVNISRETLVDLLNMDGLTLDEIDVLKYCANWVDEEVERLNLEPNPENKQEIFKTFKNLIRFSEISIEQLKKFKPIMDLLSSDELNSLFFHHLNLSKFAIECTTARKKLTLNSASCKEYNSTDINVKQFFSEFSKVFKANRHIFITNIYTFLPQRVENSVLSIYDSVSLQKVELNYEKSLDEDSWWYFRFIDPVELDAAKSYKFTLKFSETLLFCVELSTDSEMICADRSVKCNLSSVNKGFHCLKKIDFY